MSQSKPFSPEEFKAIFSKVPRLTVDAVIRTPTGVVLTLRKGNIGWDNMWHTPGGTLLFKEKLEDGIHRVVEEELGIKIKIIKVLGYLEYHSEEKERGFGYSVSVTMLCDYVSGELKINEDASEVKTFTTLPDNIIPEQKQLLIEHWSEIQA